MAKYWLMLLLIVGCNANNQHLEYRFMRELQRSILTEEKIDQYMQEYGSADILYRPGTLENAVRYSKEMLDLLLQYSKKINRPFSLEYVNKALREHYNEQLEKYCLEIYLSGIIAGIPRDIIRMQRYIQNFVCTYGYLPCLRNALMYQLAISGNVHVLYSLLDGLCVAGYLTTDFIEQTLHAIMDKKIENSEAIVAMLVEHLQRLSGSGTESVPVFRDEVMEVSAVSTNQNCEMAVEHRNTEPATPEQLIMSTLRNLYPEISEELVHVIVIEAMGLLRQQPSSSQGYSEEQLVHVLNEAMLTVTMNGMTF